MEDPLSPTTSDTVVDQMSSKASAQWQERQSITRGPIQPAESGTLQSKRKRTPEITITSHEEQQKGSDDEDSDGETTPSDEDDYPDQVSD